MDEITVHKFKEMNLKGATVINGFPTAGLVTGISGVLLNEGRRRNIDVITLIAQAIRSLREQSKTPTLSDYQDMYI